MAENPKLENCPRFIDRWTIEYVRTYPHPVERVWRATTDPKEFGVWFIAGKMDARVGGAYEFETGDDGFKGVVLSVDAPHRIRFGGPAHEEGWFEYELTPVKGGTQMRFVQCFSPKGTYKPNPDDPGGDIPVPGTPWAPGFVGGWHEFWDALGDFMDAVPIGSRLPPSDFTTLGESWVQSMVRMGAFKQKNAAGLVSSMRRHERWMELNRFYRAFIREHCPPE
jgi:uncharacterized protein YndB with AHSA1/START domain